MYILIKQDVPDKMVPVIAAHASLACYKMYEQDSDMKTWINGIFKKVVCSITSEDFERLKSVEKI